MGVCKKIIFLGVSALLLASCASSRKNNTLSFADHQEDRTNASLPVVQGIKTINDVQSVGFEWQPIAHPERIEGFVIYRMQADRSFRRIGVVHSPFATHYYDDGLTPQRQYYYQIATMGKDGGISTMSKTISVRTSFINPVENVFASMTSPREIKIFWTPHPNPSIAKYIIQREDDQGKFANIGVVKNRLFVEYFDKKLGDGQAYRYRVIAENFEGAKSLPSAVVVGKTKNPPSMVSDVQASADLTRKIALKWQPSTQRDIVGYKVYASDTLDGKYKEIAQVRDTRYTDNVDTDGVDRFYKVVALDKDGIEGELPQGAIKGATLPRPPTPIITKGTIEDGRAIIAWEAIKDARVKNYAIYRFENNARSKPLRYGAILGTQFVDKNMENGRKYRYQVVSVDSEGLESRPSKEVELRLDR
ncbi:fibronectin type III domain-containing protein [Helicobacter baculiformis]|uniref:Fibronectin type III domain-containing protein n=1 Tax=Helicobacter baculiformis TaxID=427351 RepID=A0ABV7ZHS3_9HELI|nr:fibronectin type III domain-containing protein [Helicobacter baculiformis]